MEDLIRQIFTCLVMAVTFSDTRSFKLMNSIEKPNLVTKDVPPRSERLNSIVIKQPLSAATTVTAGGSLILECEAGAKPTPTIHWLMNGERIMQGHSTNVVNDEAYFEQSSHNHDLMPLLQIGNTKGRLVIPCMTTADIGIYTCVVDTPTEREVSSTFVDVEATSPNVDCAAPLSGTPPTIHMWETHRFEYEGADVQLFCRASGFPQPIVTWYDRNNILITHQNPNYRLLRNGDLLVKNVNWFEHMGQYRCVATNPNGEDEQTSFLYPTLP